MSIGRELPMLAVNESPAEHNILVGGHLSTENITLALSLLWKHGVYEPIIVTSPRLIHQMLHFPYEKIVTRMTIMEMIRGRPASQNPFRMIPAVEWHKDTLRGYLYDVPVHSIAEMPDDTLVIFDPIWHTSIRMYDGTMQTQIVLDGQSSKIIVV